MVRRLELLAMYSMKAKHALREDNMPIRRPMKERKDCYDLTELQR
jgi:hypothetical protein